MNIDRKSHVKLAACAVGILAAFALPDCLAQTSVPRFETAEPVWAKGQAEELNSSVRLKATFDAEAGAEPFLRITGTSAYRIRLNGRYVGYGPARSPKGFFRVDEWPLGAAMREGRNELEIDAVGYNCNSFYFQDQSAFLQAEVVADGKALRIDTTARDGLQHCIAFREYSVAHDPGVRIGLRVHARVERTGVTDGTAFAVGTCSVEGREKRDIANFQIPISSVTGDGYAWYDVEGVWQPTGGETIWISNGRRVNGRNPCTKAVYIDQIELIKR